MASHQQALLWRTPTTASNWLLTNLKFYLKLDESSWNTTDIVWSKVWTAINQATFATGKINNWWSFDGTADYFRFADHSDFDFWTWAISISFWCYQNSLANYKHISNQRNNNSSSWAQVVVQTFPWSGTWDIMYFFIYNWSAWQAVTSTNGSHSATTREHWVVTRSSDWVTMKIYKNWSLNNTATTTARNGNNNWYWCIWENIWQPAWRNWKIDEYWIWNRELSLTDVQALYNSWNWLPYWDFTS